MHADITMLALRNTLAFSLMTAMLLAGNVPVFQQELLRLWKTLNTPLLPKRSAGTNHKSNKFWEIDMTKFEP